MQPPTYGIQISIVEDGLFFRKQLHTSPIKGKTYGDAIARRLHRLLLRRWDVSQRTSTDHVRWRQPLPKIPFCPHFAWRSSKTPPALSLNSQAE